MPLAPGTRLGPYQIVEMLDAGGMGEVYRARDPRLGREVAVKIVPESHAADPERLARFEREARAVSKLSHPHICALYDVGREGGVEYLVMELLEGETLAARIGRGAMPFEQVLRVGRQIAAGLAAAHAQGIVHRDLKPANVFLTAAGAKLLDFGLAKPFERGTPAGGDAFTRTAGPLSLTESGMTSGTAPYMAPEQVEARPADARADLFALGAVLFEMATGQRAFQGSSAAAVMSAILTHEPPPVSSLAPAVSPAFDRLVRRCLAKDPNARWSSAHDLELQLEEIADASGHRAALSAPAPAATRRPGAWPWAIAVATSVALLAVLFVRGMAPAGKAAGGGPVVRFPIAPPEGGAFSSNVDAQWIAVSPDGGKIAYLASGPEHIRRVWVRPIDATSARPLVGTDGARSLGWSPDSRAIAFCAGSKLKRIEVASGAVSTICDLTGEVGFMINWGSAGEILFSSIVEKTIYRVPEDGGELHAVLSADSTRGQERVVWPWYLPDGKRFVYLMQGSDGEDTLMYFAPGRPPRPVMPLHSNVAFTRPDLLLYAEEGVLLGRRFDWEEGRVRGAPFLVADSLNYFRSTGAAAMGASEGRTLAYSTGLTQSRIAWYDRAGRELGTFGTAAGYHDVSLSEDGKRLLYSVSRPGPNTLDVWSADLERGSASRLTSHWSSEFSARLLPDRRTVIYSGVERALPHLYALDLVTGRNEEFLPPTGFQVLADVTPDGRTLAYIERAGAGIKAWTTTTAKGGPVGPLLPGDFDVGDLKFSPDGRAVAFLSDESGQFELYVAPYPGPGEKLRISTAGATLLRWPRGGNEVFYVDRSQHVTAVEVRTSPALAVGRPTVLFTMPGRGPWWDFDVSADGRRLVAIEPLVDPDQVPIDVVVNWPEAAAR